MTRLSTPGQTPLVPYRLSGLVKAPPSQTTRVLLFNLSVSPTLWVNARM